MDLRAKKLRFTLLEVFYWLTYGSFTTYLVSFVIDRRGGTASLSGLMLALFMLGGCAGQYVIGRLCDKKANNRVIFMIGMSAVALIQIAIWLMPGFILMAVGWLALGFVLAPLGTVVDTWVLHSFEDGPTVYPPIRAYASLGYACLMIVMGWSIRNIGHIVMPIASACFALCAILTARSLPEIPPLHDAPVTDARAGGVSAFRALPRALMLLFLCMALLGAANNPLLTMNLLILESIGGTVTHTGVATAFNTLAEFIVMRFGGQVQRLPSGRRMMIAGAMYIVSTGIMIVAPVRWMMYGASFLSGLAYGIFLPARRAFAVENAPEHMRNRVNNTVDMCYMNIGGLIGNQASGLVIDHMGVRAMLGICVALQFSATACLTALNAAVNRRRPGQEKKGR